MKPRSKASVYKVTPVHNQFEKQENFQYTAVALSILYGRWMGDARTRHEETVSPRVEKRRGNVKVGEKTE